MNKKKWIWLIGSVLALAFILVISLQWWVPSLSAQTLTEAEANEAAKEVYPGEIIQTTKSDGEYRITMNLETGTYLIRIDAKSGEVISVNREAKAEQPPSQPEKKPLTINEVKAILAAKGEVKSIDLVQENEASYYKAVVSQNNKSTTFKIDSYSGEIIGTATEPPPLLTKEEAIKLALQEQNGTVDEVEFEEPPDQSPYYLVEIEKENGEDAVVQVDAYTREVKNVLWEEHEEDEDEDEDEDEEDESE
ncbi:PepSY domain-containing protein [Bacillus sp. SA1-12]|uniref:PepSY domain-containing protein n=1 Tax=Bacillus sp. SA1-12 TaxID=1455638 RepID=UPI000697890D|nr:PepSY domain-containing protein [Bacillus sp. SA1-12]